MEVQDCRENLLKDGASVVLIKCLKVIKKIRLTDNDEEIENHAKKTKVFRIGFLRKG